MRVHEAAMSGLLIDGHLVQVAGVTVIAPREQPWNRLTHGQVRANVMGSAYRPQFKILHKTIADDPEKIVGAVGSSINFGGVIDTIAEWARMGRSGTHEVTGHDGTTACTEDLVRFIGWHAGAKDADANPRSWGHEIKEHAGGGVNISALEAAVRVTLVDTVAIGVQQQCPKRYKNNVPNPRFRNGGRDLIGVFGHRDVTEQRGYWDPGDVVFDMLAAAGFERFDFYAGEDLAVWTKRQKWLQAEGYYHGVIDGIAGPGTTAACLEAGFPHGIWALARELAEHPAPAELR